MRRFMLIALVTLAVLAAQPGEAARLEARQALRDASDGAGDARGWLARLVDRAGSVLSPLRRAAGAAADGALARRRRSTDYPDGDDPSVRAHWAVLVAGSNGWGNYRHQADVLHAYQVLRGGGFRRDRIILMVYDDLAHHEMNPFPGKVFNKPGGPDVYEGAAIDYRGADVSVDTLLAVLRGDRRAVQGKGTGRVLESGPHDKVFMFYSDHGSAGVLGMPEGPFLYADQLLGALRHRARGDGFQEMVLYIEACESGSMFEGLLDDRLSIYATTAANAVESSWATYCPEFFSPAGPGAADNSGDSGGSPSGLGHSGAMRAAGASGNAPGPLPPPPPAEWTTCLGDLYSVAWMEDAEATDLTHETLEAQFHALRLRASNNFSYVQGSHVMRYGDLDIDAELAGDYQGMMHNGSAPEPSPSAPTPLRPANALLLARRAADAAAAHDRRDGSSTHRKAARHAPQRDADLLHLAHAAARSANAARRAEAAAALASEVGRRRAVDDAARAAAAVLMAGPRTGPPLLELFGLGADWRVQGVEEGRQGDEHERQGRGDDGAPLPPRPSRRLASARRRLQAVLGGAVGAEQGVEAVVTRPPPARPPAAVGAAANGGAKRAGRGRAAGAALVDDWGCLRSMVAAWESACGRMDQYAMRHTRLMANLCNARLAPTDLGVALAAAGACSGSGQLLA